ncbi:uncharacterized protein LOC126811798 [Patella vulgata]|uniref:uncharacterized protein LOC126811798 n=1 Tax=Patella vulgata TaxID=6465 RepID=UPI00218097BD|nr:uncharacterized protein LOC126811798 [Patella vulgata]
MASSMFTKKICASCYLSAHHWKTTIRHSSATYYVLLPEVPPDTPETNAIMRFRNPAYSTLRPDGCVTGPAKLSIQYETKLGNLIEKLKDPKDEKTFESVFEPIERADVPLSYAYNTVKLFYFIKKNTDFEKAFLRMNPQVEKARAERWLSETLYDSVKEVAANRSNLNEYQQRLIDIYLLEARKHGVELGPKKKECTDLIKMMKGFAVYFNRNVHLCTKMYSDVINNFSYIKDLPHSVITHIAADRSNPTQGPWTITLDPPVYLSVLNSCSDRITRYKAWIAYNTRCGVEFHKRNVDNKQLLNDILLYRDDYAKLLGYGNYAELSMENKMAGSLENVLTMLETYKTKIGPIVNEDIAELQQFASSKGFDGKLEMWDVQYWRTRHRNHIIGSDLDHISEYFPFETVLEKLFAFFNLLFGITIRESNSKIDVWSEDVRYFNVYDENDEEVASFYMDPYAKNGKMSYKMSVARDRSDLVGTKPLSYLCLDLDPPLTKNTPVVMNFQDLYYLLKDMGLGLQQLLTKVPYSELTGQKNMELDAVDICANVMKRWCFQPQFLQNISSHVETQKQMPLELAETLIKDRYHFRRYNFTNLLYLSALDMELHVSQDDWSDIMTRIWKEYMPLPLNREDTHPYSFVDIISGGYEAGFYSHVWSNMIAADIFEAFKEVDHNKPEQIRDIGKRFRDTYLSLGSGIPAGEVFRRFRGRDPSLDALLAEYGVSTD